ncbi:MAG: DUF2085 domain-containing protein [Acidobacteriota bacterium]
MTRFRRAFQILAILWAIAVPVAVFAASRRASSVSSAGYVFALVVYGIGRLVCHQRPERSFYLFGAPLAVCARCAGIYAGAALMAMVEGLRTDPAVPRSINVGGAAGGVARRILLLAFAPTAATLFYEWTTHQMPGHWTRAASGAVLGAAIAWIVCRASRADAVVKNSPPSPPSQKPLLS